MKEPSCDRSDQVFYTKDYRFHVSSINGPIINCSTAELTPPGSESPPDFKSDSLTTRTN
ncbi:hypothetical protein H8356DRAFT_1320618 [Neocallimastix lanati (nom. inval.)]|nr:hypothetical protein H8356DRAFT_1320618 [Neocallimastix sp. JGI-2020a]